MRLRYLAHASFLVEAGGVRLVTDPWLDGPTYLGAWWQFPAPAARAAELGPIDYVYLTHEHVDHFHEPTLRALPRDVTILIGRFMSPRFRDKLRALGFARVRELPHGRQVALGDRLRATSYQYRGDDTALVLDDGEATLFNLNDCLLRGRSLAAVLERHPHPDLLAMSFANAEAYPIVYDFEDPLERVDWDDRSLFDGFLDKVRLVAPRAFVPFASMFCFLSDELFAINERIVSPATLLARARAGEVAAVGLGMNPGDRWSPERGHEIVAPVDWSRKNEILRRYQQERAAELAALAAAEIVPGGRDALAAAFAAFFDGFAARIPAPLRKRLDLSLRIDVDGPAGGVFWLRFSRGKLDRAPPPTDDAWDARLVVRDWPLWRAVTRADTWQSFGVSCRFRVTLRRGVREREVLFWFLLYLDDMGYLSPWRLVGPRALGVAWRRRRELAEYARELAGGRFVDESLRGKFSAS
ncbi:MAG TPA: MBL fold metallo-hydrolase [Polyangia bacterium]|jgi:glyoxylase-like metal-dependent hydrolase (beta-lactamase superfamily II)